MEQLENAKGMDKGDLKGDDDMCVCARERERDDRVSVGLNGCGIVAVNAPWYKYSACNLGGLPPEKSQNLKFPWVASG